MSHLFSMDPKAVIEELSTNLDIKSKDKQEEAILAVLKKNDVFAILPKGYGKSVIYGLYHRHLTSY